MNHDAGVGLELVLPRSIAGCHISAYVFPVGVADAYTSSRKTPTAYRSAPTASLQDSPSEPEPLLASLPTTLSPLPTAL